MQYLLFHKFCLLIVYILLSCNHQMSLTIKTWKLMFECTLKWNNQLDYWISIRKSDCRPRHDYIYIHHQQTKQSDWWRIEGLVLLWRNILCPILGLVQIEKEQFKKTIFTSSTCRIKCRVSKRISKRGISVVLFIFRWIHMRIYFWNSWFNLFFHTFFHSLWFTLHVILCLYNPYLTVSASSPQLDPIQSKYPFNLLISFLPIPLKLLTIILREGAIYII